MMRNIFAWTLLAALIVFLAMWLIGGGFLRGWTSAQRYLNPVSYFSGSSEGGSSFRLPWQPDLENMGAIPGNFLDATSSIQYVDPLLMSTIFGEDDAQSYGEAREGALDAQNRENPSPYAGSAFFDQNIRSLVDSIEPGRPLPYIVISAEGREPVSFRGWSIESLAQKTRLPIPLATETLITGTVNTLGPVQLAPFQIMFLTLGSSPVGSSFRENICSAYLQQFQQFTPRIESQCPDESQNLWNGDDPQCTQYIASHNNCTFQEVLPPLSTSCRAFIQNRMTYNGCVAAHKMDPEFATGIWRLYFSGVQAPWAAGHDIVRLLDAEGRVVDVFQY